MVKQAGLGDNFYVAGFDLSGDINSLSRIGGGSETLNLTGIDKSAFERRGGPRDGGIEFVSYFNKDTGRAHPRLSLLPTTDQVATYYRGTVLGGPAASLVAKQINYDGTRGDDGELTFAVEAQANGFGLQWGEQLTAGKRTDAAATNGAGIDFAASSAFGLQAFLHVFAFTGTSVTVKIQESADDGAVDPYADVVGGTFTAAVGITSERIATASGLTVERWLRVVTTGVFSNVVFAVMVVKNLVATVF